MVQEDKERLAAEKDSPGSEELFSLIQPYINSFNACHAMKCADDLQEYWRTLERTYWIGPRIKEDWDSDSKITS